MSGLEIEVALGLIALAFAAGCMDAIAGGGGLLTLPGLLLAGLDPVTAIATNKAQSSFGSGSATLAFARRRLIDWRFALPMAGLAFIGSVTGAAAVSHVPTQALRAAMPLLLIAVALYAALSRRITDADARARLGPLAFALTAAAGIGFYDGLFGPGTGSFFLLAFVTLMGFGVLRATAHTKLLNFASNLGGLVFFALAGQILWAVALAMGVAQWAGAQIGARLVLRHGARLVRPLLVTVCVLMALRLLADPANPWRQMLSSSAASAAQLRIDAAPRADYKPGH